MKRTLIASSVMIAVLLLCAAPPMDAAETSAESPYWMILEKGKRLYRTGEYGDALLTFEDASRGRREHFMRLERILVETLSFPDFRRLGDALDLAEQLLGEKNFVDARAALAELYTFVPRERLQNSTRKAIESLRSLRSYPEADFWIGETFRAEGELGIALGQYRKAYEARALLEIPDEAYTVLYRMAEILRDRQEYNEMEARLLEVVASDPLWSDASNDFLRSSLDRSLANEGVDQVLSLYRMDAVQTAKAHRMLAFHYYATGRHDRAAAHLIFAFVIQTTAVIDELKRVDMDWRFEGFRAILDAAQKRPSLAGYLAETEYFKTCYYLAASLYATGKQSPAFELWRILARRQEAGEWRVRSARQLQNPTVEKVIEAP